MILELIREEILASYPNSRSIVPYENKYEMHCSKAFFDKLQYDFKKSVVEFGFSMLQVSDESLDMDKATITVIQDPVVGRIDIIQDCSQGYKIEKV